MDARNLFESTTTYRLIRLEYLVGLIVCFYFLLSHLGEVAWLPAVLLFVYIDVIGYIPGAIAFHRSRTKRISKAYYVLYNTMHSMATQAVVVIAWCLLFGPSWALLVIPIHLFGDRALFGNFLKPFSVAFEPQTHPAFTRLRQEVEQPVGAEAPVQSALADPVATT